MRLTKRSLSMIMAVILCATMAISSTLAYLTDTDQHVNTMVLGNVDIEQNEVFKDDQLLMPAVENKEAPSGWNNAIEKRVSVTNTGKNDAYVRTIYAFEMGSLSEDDFLKYVKPVFNTNAIGEGKEWYDVRNHGQITITGQNYYMMSVIRKDALALDATSAETLQWVYLDPKVDRAEIEAVDGNKDGKLTVVALTQGVQVDGFADAEAALNAAFTDGDELTTANHPWLGATGLNPMDDASYWYEKDPTATVFEIKSGEQLAYFAKLINDKKDTFAGDTIKITADIDMNGIEWTPAKLWNPEANATLTIDGGNHTIKNFKVTGGSGLGFFGDFAGKLVIKDLTFDYANIITSGSQAAVVIGKQYGNVTLDNVDVKNSTIETTAEKGIRVAALVGQSFLHDGPGALTVKNCDVVNTTVTGYHNVAGLVGSLMQYDVRTEQWELTGNTVKNCTINVTSNNEKYGSVYAVEGSAYPHTYSQSAEYFTALGNTEQDNTCNIAYVDESIRISTADELVNFEKAVNRDGNTFFGKTVKLAANIDLKNVDWTPIGQTGATQFLGTFDGQGYTISNLNIDTTNTLGQTNYSTGLFGWLNAGTVKNLTIDGATIKAVRRAGAIAGYLELGATVENCVVKNAEIVCSHVGESNDNNDCGDKAGAVVGYMNGNCSVVNCTAEKTTVKAGRDAGQIVGAGYTSRVTGCKANNVTVSSCSTVCKGGNLNDAVIGRVLGN